MFYNQTRRITLEALRIAEKYGLGGRDSLIITNYLLNNVRTMHTHNEDKRDRRGGMEEMEDKIRRPNPSKHEIKPTNM